MKLLSLLLMTFFTFNSYALNFERTDPHNVLRALLIEAESVTNSCFLSNENRTIHNMTDDYISYFMTKYLDPNSSDKKIEYGTEAENGYIKISFITKKRKKLTLNAITTQDFREVKNINIDISIEQKVKKNIGTLLNPRFVMVIDYKEESSTKCNFK